MWSIPSGYNARLPASVLAEGMTDSEFLKQFQARDGANHQTGPKPSKIVKSNGQAWEEDPDLSASKGAVKATGHVVGKQEHFSKSFKTYSDFVKWAASSESKPFAIKYAWFDKD